MKSRLIFFICIFTFITKINSSSPISDISGDVRDPKSNLYSTELENSLINRNYIKVLYKDFSSSFMFKKAHREIYKEEYTDILPNKIDYYVMKDELCYCMLSDRNFDDPPILTFLILENNGIKYVFYKINYQLTYELVEKEYYDPNQNWNLKTRMVKVFY